MPAERVQKILAKAGISSRRQAEELITEGVVTVNGKIAKLGDKAELGKDAIKVRGKLLRAFEAPVYLAFHKPRNVISMLLDPEGRPTLAGYLGKVNERVFPVGRLDFSSEGLILLTNDGKFAEDLQKRDDVLRVYHVKVKGHPDAEMLKRLERGAKFERKHGYFKPHSVRLVQDYTAKAMIEFSVLGGGAVDVKSYFDTRGFLVERIIRTAIGQLTLKGIPSGSFKILKASQARSLVDQPELGLKKLEQEIESARPSQRLIRERDRPLVVTKKPEPEKTTPRAKVIVPRKSRKPR